MKKAVKSIICIMLAAFFVCSLTGCGETEAAEKAVNEMFAAFKSGNIEDAKKYVNLEDIKTSNAENYNTNDNINMIFKGIFSRLDYKVISSEKLDKNTVKVTAEISAVDMKPVMVDFFKQIVSQALQNALNGTSFNEEEMKKKMEEIFLNEVDKEGRPTVSKSIDIVVEKTEDGWKIKPNEIFSDAVAVTGGFVKAAEEAANALNF